MQKKPSKRKEDLLKMLAYLNDLIYESMLLKDQFLIIYASPDRATTRKNLHKRIVSAIALKIPAFIELSFIFLLKRHFVLNCFSEKNGCDL